MVKLVQNKGGEECWCYW